MSLNSQLCEGLRCWRETFEKRGGNTVRLRCAICEQPLFVSRRVHGALNRWFKHDGKSSECPWYEGKSHTPEQTKALIYRGYQEGKRHRELKQLIAKTLEIDTLASSISQEKTTFGEVLRGEWRRPDVTCRYRDEQIVFEVQLSYTFLSDAIGRDEFYRKEGIHIIWVFAEFDLRRAAVTDEAFFNRRNVFVLDANAINATRESGRLTFSGYRQIPKLVNDQICDSWSFELVLMDEVKFSPATTRPYFFDYDAERLKVENERASQHQAARNSMWSIFVQKYLDAALEYFESDYEPEKKTALLLAVDKLCEHENWSQGLVLLRSENFYGWHSVLAVLMTIKNNRPIGYKVKSVYQVMESAFRASRPYGKHAFAILYLWAYKIYKPNVKYIQRERIKNFAAGVKASVLANEKTYIRCTIFDEAIGLLFPEIEGNLRTDFGNQ